jgi:hypothetical protein
MVPGKDEDIHPSMGVSQPYPLTDTLTDKLQNYHGIAIRSNYGNLEGMKAEIYASIIHCVSSKKRNLHTWCLDGPDSWCRFKQDKANNTDLYNCGRGLSDNIIAQIRPIRLSSNDLLVKCLDGKTQNQNESLNGMIWNRLPKIIFVRGNVLQLGVYDAVAHFFNMGSRAFVDILQQDGLVLGYYFEEGVCKADKKRVKKADHCANPDVRKRRRKVVRGQKKKREDKNQETEVNSYEAGTF